MRYLLIFMLAILTACSVTDKSVIGNYVESKGKKIKINGDHTFVMDATDNSSISGKWKLKGNYLLLDTDNSSYKFFDSISFQVKGKKIKTPDITMWPHNVILTYKKVKSN